MDWNYDMDSCPLDTKVFLLSANDNLLLPQREFVGTLMCKGHSVTRGKCLSGDPEYFYRSKIVACMNFIAEREEYLHEVYVRTVRKRF